MNEHDSRTGSRLSADGHFANGVSVVAIIRFIRAYDCDARIDDVAAYFNLTVDDISAAVAFHSRNFNAVHPLVVEGEE
jgi:hypothetical protein